MQGQQNFSEADLTGMLNLQAVETERLFEAAASVRSETLGNRVYFRGLVEFSNRCAKNCLYCGIRRGNRQVLRYELTDTEVLDACRLAWKKRLGSVVLQSGERSSPAFVHRVDRLLRAIKKMSRGELGITLSCGEQTTETYRKWFGSGAHRYLLRMESSDPALYAAVHPRDRQHQYARRLECLQALRVCGYQVGTGVMIGLPGQRAEQLARDLLFIRDIDADMVGMGPYVEHEQTPLYGFRQRLLPGKERLELSLRMLALLRLLMPDINMAATTALQALHPQGREMALKAGANVLMPNLTPAAYREDYLLYENKPRPLQDPHTEIRALEACACTAGMEAAYDVWGDSPHFFRRTRSDI